MASTNFNEIPYLKNKDVPDREHYEKCFEDLERIKHFGFKRLMAHFIKLFGTKPPVFFNFSNQEFLSAFCGYRVISEKNFQRIKLNPAKVKSFSHPCKKASIQQRFNKKGFPALYLAQNANTAIDETRQQFKKGNFYLSKWEFKKVEQLFYINFFYGKKGSKVFKFMADNFAANIDTLIANYTEDKRKSLRFLLAKITKLSLCNDYNITSFLGHYYLHEFSKKGEPSIGFLMYPSVKKGKVGINYAVNPRLISDSILICTEVKKLKLNSHKKLGSWVTLDEIGIVDGKDILWKKFNSKIISVIFFNHINEAFFELDAEQLYNLNSENSGEIKRISKAGFQGIQEKVIDRAKRGEVSFKEKQLMSVQEEYFVNDIKCSTIEIEFEFKFNTLRKSKAS